MKRQILQAVALCAGTLAGLAMLGLSAQETRPVPEQQADAAHGKVIFEHRCTGCHALDANREGPRLGDVYGRKAASVAGFQYSESLAHSGLTWSPATLEQWLADPDAMVPGNNMSFATPKAADREDLIAYLQQAAADK